MRTKKFRERLDLFLAGEVELYADSLVKDCIPHGEYVELLGKGGQTVVLGYKDTLLGEKQVLQIMLPGLTMEAEKRFLRSARIARKIAKSELQSGRVPPFPLIYQVNEYPPFIVSQFVKGVTLRAYLERQPTLGLYERCEIFKHLAFGLELIHNNGTVHRDIKPDNVIIDEYGWPYWIDFGIALSAYENPLTRTDQALGTPDYAAPEQLKNAANVDHRADVYSFGKLLYFLVTCDESFNPEKLPYELIMVVPRALQDDVERRHQSVRELLEDVAAAYPDFRILETVPRTEGDVTVGRAFQDLIVLFDNNPGKVKKLFGLSMIEYEELMRMAKAEIVMRE